MTSVCLATYNGSKYVGLQIDSILCQLSENDELIISDDNSVDNTIDIIKGYNDDRIKLICNNSKSNYRNNHKKVTSNFQNALQVAKGDIVFISDQDDVWKPNKIEKCRQLLADCDLVISNCELINEEGKSNNEMLWILNPIQKNIFKNIVNMPFHGCSMAFNSKILKISLPFPNGLIMHDNWIGFLALFVGKIKFFDEPLQYYRRHRFNVSNVKGKSSNSYIYRITYRIILIFQIMTRLCDFYLIRRFGK